ncbi:hypothetical protein CY34DRAFT_801183 [Suillus luteus UH-Slu-Lm8-n1]|uniref:Unplaced genomic scaffold CY34scaffold_37, whole genome shotgun sequence n=1 Tax=Suillus luteus UH-Slu-Lm8-n1 TaxID=930992 RepID=A0A0D0BRQ5_9AGAM|nr:hypothetical protein CY34DRAFT_801183 [Suillus luteus UH-Slu-Lm8-n1]
MAYMSIKLPQNSQCFEDEKLEQSGAAVHQCVCTMISIIVHVLAPIGYHRLRSRLHIHRNIAIDCVNFTCCQTLLNTASRIMK